MFIANHSMTPVNFVSLESQCNPSPTPPLETFTVFIALQYKLLFYILKQSCFSKNGGEIKNV